MKRTLKQVAPLIAKAIKEVRSKDIITVRRINAACKKYDAPRDQVYRVAGWNKGGLYEYEVKKEGKRK
jgi:hypothetical protein